MNTWYNSKGSRVIALYLAERALGMLNKLPCIY
jgi:hypothetical protein